jgi:HAD superfamily hydrolase (TIGR01509 family)
MKYKALIFDFFGVISSEAAPLWFEEHLSRSEGRTLEERHVRPVDRGEMAQEDMFRQLSEISKVSAKEIENDWLSRAQIDKEVVDYMYELKGKYRLGLLTNAFLPFFEALLERSGTKDLFETIVMSSEIGHVKPEPEMYLTILQKMNLHPEDTLMIDDNPKNVEGARNVGMNAIVFLSLAQLRSVLD